MDPTEKLRDSDAELLKAAWKRRFGKSRGHRKLLAEKYGVNESFIGLLMNGHRPISALWKVRMAAFLAVSPQEVWPDFDVHAVIAEQLPPHVADLLRAALTADPELVKAAETLLTPKR